MPAALIASQFSFAVVNLRRDHVQRTRIYRQPARAIAIRQLTRHPNRHPTSPQPSTYQGKISIAVPAANQSPQSSCGSADDRCGRLERIREIGGRLS